MAIKSLRIQIEVDVAGKAHKCKGNSRHPIQRGDKRLKVRNGWGWNHYCRDCARKMIRRDMDGLKALDSELGTGDEQENA